MNTQLAANLPQKTPPLIQKTPNVSGGVACVGSTRIPVWTLVELQRQGRTDHDLLNDFPSLTLPSLRAAWDYYQKNRSEIDEDLAAQDAED